MGNREGGGARAMATAKAYYEWEDVGLAFSDNELASYDPFWFAQKRVDAMAEHLLIVERKLTLAIPMSIWVQAKVFLVQDINWITTPTVALGTESPLPLKLPDPKSKEGKALMVRCNELEPKDWVGLWYKDARNAMRHLVTIGRRCNTQRSVSGWKQEDKKASNRLANSVMKEIHHSGMLADLLKVD
jgi:hypothetical protein